ncbi:MAG: hypothetical protein R3275_04465 [Saprospiraceae bacterium]|nr:hypothetical protein [Saprospiraceae bacterium]
MRRGIYLLIGTALILGSLLWFSRSSDRRVGVEKTETASPDPVDSVEINRSPLIAAGDSLWTWKDSLMDFEYAMPYGSQPIKGTAVYDEDGDGKMDLTWKALKDILYAQAYFEKFGMEVYIPAFPEEITELNGQQVSVEGFTIPFDGEEAFVALSATPFSNCFFCGKGSPASVISLYLEDENKTYKVDEFIRFEGTLRLNYDDPEEFYYVLDDAQEANP